MELKDCKTVEETLEWLGFNRDEENAHGQALAHAFQLGRPQWLPIESAPKQQRIMLMNERRGAGIRVIAIGGYYQKRMGNRLVWGWWNDNSHTKVFPTHWQPLPPPPAEGGV